MNVRDPFGLRSNPAVSILRSVATQKAQQLGDKAIEAGASAIQVGRQAVEDMSFSVPRNVPSFGNHPQRIAEDRLWGSSGVTARSVRAGGVLGGVQDRVGGLLDPGKNSLPMYKDKPYAYPPSQRLRPIYRRKRVVLLAAFAVFALLWWSGALDKHKEKVQAPLRKWNWLKDEGEGSSSGKKVDWTKRRDRVVEAFELSWNAYERYAWGK
jgi:endoplasmic reticulum Man9GlcNAc2 1,2-alpha-mannosidase